MKTVKIIAATFSIVCIAIYVHAQGSLTPPGAPAPTMKTLEQAEPRTPISSLPFYITEPGSYYLTSDLDSSSGIFVFTNNVTIDLMGFTISGTGTGHGIYMIGATNSPGSNITVRNGSIRNCDDGIEMENVEHIDIRDMHIAENSGVGINGSNIRFGQIRRCIASSNQIGIRLGTDDSGETSGVVVEDCVLSNNDFWGINLQSAAGICRGNRISDCMVSGNGNAGIYMARNVSYNEIIGCSSINNGLDGISISALGTVCEGNSIIGCTVRGNYARGIYIVDAHRGRIDQNHVSHTGNPPTYGIWTSGTTNNVICRNVCMDHTFNYFLSPADQAAPLTTAFGAGGFGSPTDPWANFDF